MSHTEKRRRIDDDEESNSEVESNGLESSLLPTVLEPSIFGVQPTNDFVRVVSDFLFSQVGRENVEVNNLLFDHFLNYIL